MRASMVADVKCLSYNSGWQAMTTKTIAVVAMSFVLSESLLLVGCFGDIHPRSFR